MKMLSCFIFISILAGFGCATHEPAVERENEAEDLPVGVEEEQLPAWYTPGKIGEAAGGRLSGFGTALGSEPEWTVANATRQANVNLRFWIDEQLETARRQIEESDERVADRDFILDLRNSLVSLELSKLPEQQEIFEDNGTIRVLVRIRVDASKILEILDRQLESHDEIRGKLRSSGFLQSWQTR
ncbi:MAG: hypothetical protein WD599_02795 [Balneolaceae bacterium]